MIVVDKNTDDIRFSDNYVALGSFDGLHLGHVSLIKKAVQVAKQKNGKSIVYTFKNHPRSFIDKNFTPKLIMGYEEKIKSLEKFKVDIIYFKEFDKAFMELSPEQFIKYMITSYNIKGIIVGFNYRFGYRNSGDISLLEKFKDIYNYDLYVLSPYLYKQEVISSTRIRKCIEEGNVEDAFNMLDKPYCLMGNVVHGRKIGRTIGFPTANLDYDKKFILPKQGVYYTNVEFQDKIYKAITSVGTNPTVDGKKLTVETHLLNFREDIYGKKISVKFVKKIRDNKKFTGIEELKNQLNKDKNFAMNQNLVYNIN